MVTGAAGAVGTVGVVGCKTRGRLLRKSHLILVVIKNFYYCILCKTRQKGLQSNSGPMCLFVFVCWHRGEAMWLPAEMIKLHW